MQSSSRYALDRVALIGDAAHRIHPLAGQGLNLGISDAALLSNAIVQAKQCGADIGDYDLVLRQYEELAKKNGKVLSGVVELVKNSYGQD